MHETASHHPLTVGLLDSLIPQPCTLVILGAGGDLSRRKLLPAVYNLALDAVLPTNFAVLGFSADDMSDEAFRAFARGGIERHSRRPPDTVHWPDYERALFYVQGSFQDLGAYGRLKEQLEAIEPMFGIPGNRIFYLAVLARCAQLPAPHGGCGSGRLRHTRSVRSRLSPRHRRAGLSARGGCPAGLHHRDLCGHQGIHRQLALGGGALLSPHRKTHAQAGERDRRPVQGCAPHPVQRRRRQPLDPNVLALRIQPNEGLSLCIATKLPGPKVRIYPVKMDFHYGTTFGEQTPEAYERLLLDVMAGDATLFMRRDAVEASWTWIMNILDGWSRRGTRWLPEYPAGTWGPLEADRLIHAEDRKWRTL
jgi:glucose-6-phosphate 1-dehydrogenase